MELEEIVNLHDEDEILARKSLGELLRKIKSGKEVTMSDGLPNVKLTETRRGEKVLFDGHHTTLAYMLAGREYLPEIPHIQVAKPIHSGFSDSEIHVFFGKHSGKLTGEDWRDYVISWNKPEAEQLKPRKRSNMGELLKAVRSVEKQE